MQPDLIGRLIKHWPDELSGQCAFEVGLSGGLDSVALLSLLCRIREQRPQLRLSAVHVHHGLSPNADAWAEHCRRLCGALQVPLRVERVALQLAGGDSLEAVAREARYAVYRESAAEVVALAHHLDDQAETVLLQLLRGGGVRALAAMPALRPLADGKLLWRPLLGLTRLQLEQYVRRQGLSWVEDESNQDTRYRRNLLRRDILPRIAQGIPDYRQHLARAAALQADAAAILQEVALVDLQACRVAAGLDFLAVAALSAPRQRQLLLAWLQELGWAAPEPGALQEFLRQAQQAAAASCPQLALPSGHVLRFADTLQAWPKVQLDQASEVLPDCRGGPALVLPRWGGELSWEWREHGLPDDLLAAGLRLGLRQGGEKLSARTGRREVKDLLREAGLPPLLRQRWPLLYGADGQLLALPGIAVAFAHSAGPGWWPQWTPARSGRSR
ncbi:tRNA lysidine(34) synthetase TilS [Chromobacterium sphagni]|nr:tRNA lysidine(34) synthetase TilS [Chromobacterium sphagni]